MQAFFDRQIAFDSYLPGTPHEVGDIADMFPYHIWGKGNIPRAKTKSERQRQEMARSENNRRRKFPTCIEEACGYGNLQYVILAYAQGKFDILNRRVPYEGGDATPLMLAAYKGHMPIVKFLIDAAKKECLKLRAAPAAAGPQTDDDDAVRQKAFNAFINAANTLGHTALQWSIVGGHTAITRLLLDNNANPSLRDRQGFDAAFVAVQSSRLPVLMMLVEDAIAAKAVRLVKTGMRRTAGEGEAHAVADVEDSHGDGRDDQATLLGLAAAGDNNNNNDGSGNLQEAEWLGVEQYGLRYVVDVERLRALNTASAAAAAAPPSSDFHVRRTNYYVLDPATRDVEEHSLLHWAAYRNAPGVCEYLVLWWGYDVNVPDVHGRTPIIWAAREGFSEVLEFFCLHGGDRMLYDKEGFNAVQYATVRNHPEAAYVLQNAPSLNLAAAVDSSALCDAATTSKLKKYRSIRTRRNLGTVRMMLEETLFAVQAAFGVVYMWLSYLALCLVPPIFSYFPFGVYFFKNMLWTIAARHPVQSSTDVTRDIGKETGVPMSLAESVRGTWRFRLREPANLLCIVAMMCFQMNCWVRLGLTPFTSSFFAFDFLFHPFAAVFGDGGDGAVAAAGEALRANAACTTYPSATEAKAAASAVHRERGSCQLSALRAYLAAHEREHRRVYGADAALLGSGRSVLAEVARVEDLMVATPGEGAAAAFYTADALYGRSSYFGAGSRLSPLAWAFGDDGLGMVATTLPLLFCLTILCFLLTKLLAGRAVMDFTPTGKGFQLTAAKRRKLWERRRRQEEQGRRGGSMRGGGSSDGNGAAGGHSWWLQHEGSLVSSPIPRVLRARAYAWLHPRAMMQERHTQIPARAFYCPERDVIVHRYDSYSILLDCPIGRANHFFFVAGITAFTLFQFLLFTWGVQQLQFFMGLYSPGSCAYESWHMGWQRGLWSGPHTTLMGNLTAAATAGADAITATATTAADGAAAAAGVGALFCTIGGSSVYYNGIFHHSGLNTFLQLLLHGLPRKQNHYLAVMATPYAAADSASLFHRLLYVVRYYWLPTRANTMAAFLIHFAFIAMSIGAALVLRQWSGVWRGATRMELSNPMTPCQNYGGRFIAIFPVHRLLRGGGPEKYVEKADGDSVGDGVSAGGTVTFATRAHQRSSAPSPAPAPGGMRRDGRGGGGRGGGDGGAV